MCTIFVFFLLLKIFAWQFCKCFATFQQTIVWALFWIPNTKLHYADSHIYFSATSGRKTSFALHPIDDFDVRDFDSQEMTYDSTGMFHWCPPRSIEEVILVWKFFAGIVSKYSATKIIFRNEIKLRWLF